MLVIGLDAADLDVLRPLVARGEMPHVGGLMERGASGVLHSTVPPVSAPAWATFLTGVDPGRHGLYSFVVERGNPVRMQLASLADIQGPKIWDLAAAQGARPVVANIPVTWPPPAFEGAIVTGMLTPEARGVAYTHPPELQAEIERVVPGYRIDIDRELLDDHEHLAGALLEMTARRRDLFLHLMDTQRWDLLVAAFTNTDRVQHSFWRRDRAVVDDHFRHVDAHVGDMLSRVDLDETVVMLMSDHGFQGARFKLYTNRFLEEKGLLFTRRAAEGDEHYDLRRPDAFEGFQGGGLVKERGGLVKRALAKVGVGGRVVVDWSRTRAFLWSLDHGGVAVNLKSRYVHGCVEDADYESVRDEVIAALAGLRLPDGTAALRSVRRREEVYTGPHVDRAPDVVIENSDAVTYGMSVETKEVLREHKSPEGHHSPRGFVCLAGPGCRRGASLEGRIHDCVPTILHAMGLAVPMGLDGRVLVEAFDDRREVRTAAALDPDAVAGGRGYSAEEEEELRRSLEGLGYL